MVGLYGVSVPFILVMAPGVLSRNLGVAKHDMALRAYTSWKRADIHPCTRSELFFCFFHHHVESPFHPDQGNPINYFDRAFFEEVCTVSRHDLCIWFDYVNRTRELAGFSTKSKNNEAV